MLQSQQLNLSFSNLVLRSCISPERVAGACGQLLEVQPALVHHQLLAVSCISHLSGFTGACGQLLEVQPALVQHQLLAGLPGHLQPLHTGGEAGP